MCRYGNYLTVMAISTKNFDKLTFPKIPPENVVGDYLTSKRQDDLVKKYPVWDLPRISPATELVTAKRDLYDVEQRLREKKSDGDKNRAEMDAQWKDLAEKEELLKQSFMKFNKFVKENQEKRDRAEKKTTEEIALQQKRDLEIVDLRDKFEHMMYVKATLEQNIRDDKIFEDYLVSVVKATTEFKSVNDILNRYEALVDARKQLADRQERDLVALENARSHMIKLIEDKTLAIMGLNNIVADLQIRYENAKSKALYWENVVRRIKDMCALRLSELNTVRMACWNVYLQMCRRKEIEPEFEEDDTENQLMFIKKTMDELKHIVRVARRRGAREFSSGRAETPQSTR